MELRRVADYYTEEAVADLLDELGLDPNLDDPPHRQTFSAEVSLGRGRIDLSRIQVSGMLEVFHKLDGVTNGFLYMQLEWIELSTNKSDFEYQKDISQKIRQNSKSLLPAAICFVTVQTASNLPARKDFSDPSAKAIVKYGTFQEETKVEKNKKNPIWQRTFNVPVYTLDDDIITIDIVDAFDAITALPIGSFSIQLSNVLKQTNVRLDGMFNFIPTSPLSTLDIRVIFRTFKSGEFSMFPDGRPRPPELTSSASATELTFKKRKSVPSASTLSPSKSKLDVSKPSKFKTENSVLKPLVLNDDSSASATSSNMITSTKVVSDSPTVTAASEKPPEITSAVSIIKPSDSDISTPLATKVSSSFWGTSSTSATNTKQKKDQYLFTIFGHDVRLPNIIPCSTVVRELKYVKFLELLVPYGTTYT
ncbi:hypothetical protein RvY_01774 [Ramazzottius varieornatus]|uniref:C2 domain-containing protein n=1 Tax=Ramazzottius varieornatus TaxID=947166 RepID=A0A1D1ULC6_RAMVA|nr:hypothetical protein RvY_01774 [Ramazzottius varieornatus]